MATATYISGTSFSISGNVTAEFLVGRAVRCDCGTAGTFTGYITSSSYSSSTGKTTVIVSLDSGALTSQLSSVSHGNDIPASMCRATQSSVGGVILATPATAVARSNLTQAITPGTQYQASLSLMRDSLGKFPGATPPSLNLFCGDATNDTVPIGTFTRSTTGARLGQAGLIESVAAGSIRRAWDSTGKLKGWLIEGQGTNLTTYSEQFDNAVWSKVGCQVSANVALSPDGAVSSDKMQEDTTTGQHYINSPTYYCSSSGYLTFSFFAKKKERSIIQVYIVDSTGGVSASSTYFDLNLGTVTSGSGSIVALPNGWYRLSVRATVAVGNCYGRLLLHNGDSTTYAGDGVSGVYLWGGQIETAAAPSSYIPTTSAAVARSADVWTLPLAYSWYRTSEGSILVTGTTGRSLGVTQILVQYDDASYSNRIRVFRDADRVCRGSIVSADTEVANIALGTLLDETEFRVAFAWSSSGGTASLNGGSCVTDASVTLPSGLTTCRIGSDSSGGSQWGGHVSHVAYFPVALSNTQLQAITL